MFLKKLAVSVAGVTLSAMTLADAPNVVTDIAPVHSLVSQVMKGVAEPTLLVKPEYSPHEYNLRPSEARALSNADVVFWIGEDLTPWLEKSLDNLADEATKVSLMEAKGTNLLDFREGATFEAHAHDEHDDHDDHGHDDHDEHDHDEHGHDDHDDHDHHDEHGHDDHDDHDHHDEHGHDDHDDHDHHDEHGHDDHDDHDHHDEHSHDDHDDHDHHDEHGHDDHDEHEHHDEHGHDDHDDHEGHDHHGHNHEGHDPHVWLDPANAQVWLKAIAQTLAKADPENASAYNANANAAVADLDALIAKNADIAKGLGDIKFIVFHDAYQYFESRFDVFATGAISVSDASDPSPARVAEIRETVAKLGVSCVYTEPQYNANMVKSVFKGTEVVTIGVMDPLGVDIKPGENHYAEMINNLMSSLSKCKS